jgi:hypothetical protein
MHNAKTTTANAELAYLPQAGVRLTGESKAHKLREGLFVWPYALAPGGEATFRYSLAFKD